MTVQNNIVKIKYSVWWKITKRLVQLVVWSCIVWLLYAALLYPWLVFGEMRTTTLWTFSHIITTLLNIPHNMHFYESAINKDKLIDLEPISIKEWDDIDCKYPRNTLEAKNDPHIRKLGSHGQCIAPLFMNYHGSVNIMPNECSGFFDCRGDTFLMHEYVLEHPKILRNLIKVAEKPCYYIKELQPRPVLGIKEDSKAFSKRLHEYQDIKKARDFLYCDYTKDLPYQKDHTYIVIRITDSNGRPKMQLVVPRKDTAHLVGKGARLGVFDNITLLVQFLWEEITSVFKINKN